MLPYGHIDYLKTADGDMIVLVDVAGQGVPAGSPLGSSTDEAMLYSSPDSGTEGGAHEFRSSSSRYEGITAYTSHTVDPADILSAWEAMAIAQLVQAPPADDVEMLLRALGDDRTLTIQVAEMPIGSGSILEPLSLPEAAFVV